MVAVDPTTSVPLRDLDWGVCKRAIAPVVQLSVPAVSATHDIVHSCLAHKSVSVSASSPFDTPYETDTVYRCFRAVVDVSSHYSPSSMLTHQRCDGLLCALCVLAGGGEYRYLHFMSHLTVLFPYSCYCAGRGCSKSQQSCNFYCPSCDTFSRC